MKNNKAHSDDLFQFGISSGEEHKSPIKVKAKIDNKLKVQNIGDILKLPQVVQVRGEFTEEMASDFAASFHAAENSGQSIIPIVIDSYGGDVYALLSMVDIIEASSCKVATIVMGKAMSCGAFLLTCGDEGLRFASPHATILIHSASGGAFGNVDEMKINVKELVRVNKKIMEIMSGNCGHKKDYFEKLMAQKKSDWFMNPVEAKKHNIINEIRIPEFHVEIASKIEFK